MPWTKTDFPSSMKNLPAPIRNKAIEIANELLNEGILDEDALIKSAINKAKEWAANQGIKIENEEKIKSIYIEKHIEDRYVIPYGEKEWAVKEEGKRKVEYIFRSKRKAIALATSEAKKANAAVTIQKRTGKVEKRISFTPKRRGKINLSGGN